MTYEQVVSKVKAKYSDIDASSIEGTQAIQINLSGKNTEGIFYIEVKDSSMKCAGCYERCCKAADEKIEAIKKSLAL